MSHPFAPSSTSDLSACDESFIYIYNHKFGEMKFWLQLGRNTQLYNNIVPSSQRVQ